MKQEKINVNKIIEELQSIEDKKIFVKKVAEILQEKQLNMLYQLYHFYKKGFILNFLEKSLKIYNDGGMDKTAQKDGEKRTLSGTFIKLVKTSGVITKEEMKFIFWKNQKKKREKKKLIKNFNNIKLSN